MLPVEQPFKTYTGLDGKPLDNGFVWFGLPNQNPQTAPVTVFWDAAGTIPAAQPLRTVDGYIMRAGTPANVFFDGSYSELVWDSKNRQVFYARTSDEFSIATLVQSFLQSVGGSLGSTFIGFIQAGIGAIQRSVSDKLKEWVSPEDFGGTDSAAIQKAFNASPNVRFTPGVTYTITTSIKKTGRVSVLANGATIKADGDAFVFTDAAYSSWDGGYLQEITTPYTIQRDYINWTTQTSGDVSQNIAGYQPSPLDSDVFPGLSAQIQQQFIGPKIIFTSSSTNAQPDIRISDITGRFVTIVLEGATYSEVTNCSIQGGRDYAGIVFYNGVGLTRIGNAALGYNFARGTGNRALGNTIVKATTCGIVFFGNDYWKAHSNHVQGCGESGIKTYQHDGTFGAEVVCLYGSAEGNTTVQNRFDGIDVSATYPTSGTGSGHNRVENNTSAGNRSTGIFSDAQSNVYIGNKCLDNGLGGMTIKAANCLVQSNYLEGNMKTPNVLGTYASYDMEVTGDNCYVLDNVVKSSTTPAYTYALYHQGGSGLNSRNIVPTYPIFVDAANLWNVPLDIHRRAEVSNAFVWQLVTREPNSIQSVLKLWRKASEGEALSLYQGASETAVGNISVTATATAYNTSSDYRLKDNVIPLAGSGTFIDKLRPVNWTWKINGAAGAGMIAHELQAVSPSSVHGKKDALGDDGQPIYQTVEYGSAEVMANLIAEVQSLRKRIAAVEDK